MLVLAGGTLKMIAPEKEGMENDSPEKGRILEGWKMTENALPENDGTANDSPGEVEFHRTRKWWKMYQQKMMEWNMIALEKGRILQDKKMAKNVLPENDGMENYSPQKRWNNTGL